VANGKIVTGSNTVLIGSQGGVACSECPGGVAVGHPVNPSLGAKVLSGAADLDFALPGALPLVWQRQYSSYVSAEHGGYCGVLGYGWSLPLELRLTVGLDATLLHDSHGRTVTFGALSAGKSIYSPSEDLWLLRTGGASPDWHHGRFAWLSPELASSDHRIVASTGEGHTAWLFAPANWQDIMQENEPPPPSPHWIVFAQLDRFGRMQRYHWAEIFGHSRIERIEDGVGREYRLHYIQHHAPQDAWQCASGYQWQSDSGVRLARVELISDPIHPLPSQGTHVCPLPLVTYGYNAAGDLISVHDRYGDQTRRFAWHNHLMVLHQERDGPEHRYLYERYEPGGRVVEQRNQDGLDYRFTYQFLPPVEGQPRKQCQVLDSLNRVETYLFEGEAGLTRLIERTHADGSVLRYRYNAVGHLTRITDALERSVQLQVDPMGGLVSVEGPDGSITRQCRDEDTGVLLSQTDAAGRTTRYDYDALCRLACIHFSNGTTQTYAYPDPAQDKFNADKPVRVTDAQGGVQKIEYTRTGQMATHTDCTGSVTGYAYSRWGWITTMTNALGQCLCYAYDERGQVQAIHYPDENTDEFSYSSQGHLIQIVTGQFPAASAVLRSTTANVIQMQYDRWGRLTRRTHAGHSLSFAYDLAGRLIQLTNENGEHTHFTWDVMDRLIQETGFDGRIQHYHYDVAGRLMASTDGPEHTQQTIRYEWTASNQLAVRHLPATSEAPTQSIRYQWSPAAELISASVWQGDDTASQQLQSQVLIDRDEIGRVIGEVQRLYKHTPSTGEPELEFEHSLHHTLDVLGNRATSHLQFFGEIGYLRYGRGHMNGLTWQGTRLVELERDALHREALRLLCGIAISPGDNTPAPSAPIRHLRRDPAGRLEALRLTGLATDVPGNIRDSPSADTSPHLSPSLVEQLTSCKYHHDSLGQLIAIHTSSGPNHFAYDTAGRLISAQSARATTQHWRFDPAGNRLSDGMGGASSFPESRMPLSSGHLPPEWMHPDYNVLQGPDQSNPRALPSHAYWRGNRVGGYHNRQDPHSRGCLLHYRYDIHGNRIESIDQARHRHVSLGYDGGHQLVHLTQSTDGTRHEHHYRYDAFGRRLAQYARPHTGEERTEYYGWDGDKLVHTERHHPGHAEPEIIHTVYEPDTFTPLLRLSSSPNTCQAPGIMDEIMSASGPDAVQTRLRPMLQDLEGTSTQIVEQAHAIGMDERAIAHIQQQLQTLGRMAQDEQTQRNNAITLHYFLCDHLGTPLALINQNGTIDWVASLDPWGNIEHDQDSDTGLHYNRYRYYDPILGTYINQDPIGLKGGVNLSSYVANNPLQRVDPLGLIAPLVYVAAVGVVAAAGHFGRNIFNEEADGRTPENLVDKEGWKELPPEKSIYHQMGDANLSCNNSNPANNRKLISPSGRGELVFDEFGCMVKDSLNTGTFNYFSPETLWGAPHAMTDVIPYLIFGNSIHDTFTTDRFSTTWSRVIK